jgi:hypothetical protein
VRHAKGVCDAVKYNRAMLVPATDDQAKRGDVPQGGNEFNERFLQSERKDQANMSVAGRCLCFFAVDPQTTYRRRMGGVGSNTRTNFAIAVLTAT